MQTKSESDDSVRQNKHSRAHVVREVDNGIIKQLSNREQEVLTLIFDGFENKAIAKKLFISVKTVEFHKENLKQKLQVRTNRELYELDFAGIDLEKQNYGR